MIAKKCSCSKFTCVNRIGKLEACSLSLLGLILGSASVQGVLPSAKVFHACSRGYKTVTLIVFSSNPWV